jgi:fatty-acyl-CoA synthase
VFTHGTTLASSMAKIIDFSLGEGDAAVVFGPLFHVGPLMDLTLPLLLRGGRVVLGASRRFDPSTLLATIAARRGTAAPIYPTMLRRVVRLPDLDHHDLSSLRLMITGGEQVPIPVLEATHRRMPHVDLINNYGSTEGGPITKRHHAGIPVIRGPNLGEGDSRASAGSLMRPRYQLWTAPSR